MPRTRSPRLRPHRSREPERSPVGIRRRRHLNARSLVALIALGSLLSPAVAAVILAVS
jgi:hypothetical protein